MDNSASTNHTGGGGRNRLLRGGFWLSRVGLLSRERQTCWKESARDNKVFEASEKTRLPWSTVGGMITPIVIVVAFLLVVTLVREMVRLLPSTLGIDLPEEGTVAVPAQPAVPLFLIMTALKLRQSFVDTMLVSLTFSLLSVPKKKSTDSFPFVDRSCAVWR